MRSGASRFAARCSPRPDFLHPRRADQPSRYRIDRVAGGFPRALPGRLPFRHARPLFPRPHRDAHRRALARAVLQHTRATTPISCSRKRAARSGGGKAGATSGRNFSNANWNGCARRPRARRTKSVDRIDRYFEMAAQEAPEQELDVDLIIPPAPKLANRVIDLRDVAHGTRRAHALSTVSISILQRASASASSAATASANRRCSRSSSGNCSRRAARSRSARARRSTTSIKTGCCSMKTRPSGRKSATAVKYVQTWRGKHHPARLSAAVSFHRGSDQHQDRAAQRRRTQPRVCWRKSSSAAATS